MAKIGHGVTAATQRIDSLVLALGPRSLQEAADDLEAIAAALRSGGSLPGAAVAPPVRPAWHQRRAAHPAACAERDRRGGHRAGCGAAAITAENERVGPLSPRA
jgi:hypothetical protein